MFELMTKFYSEFSEFKKDMNDFKSDMNDFKSDMNDFRKETRNDIVRLENKIDTVSKTLFDGYEQTFEKLTVLEKKVDDISSRVEKQELEITVIKGGKKTKAK